MSHQPESSTITIKEATSASKTRSVGKVTFAAPMGGGSGALKRGTAILDFILRLAAIATSLAAAIAMGTTNQTLPFFTQFFQFQAQYDDFPAFSYASSFSTSLALVTILHEKNSAILVIDC